jgi:O-glycosyl hydrolase
MPSTIVPTTRRNSATFRLTGPIGLLAAIALSAPMLSAATITIDDSATGTRQEIDAFGTCIGSPYAKEEWFQQLYWDDLRCTGMRMDITPGFISPYSDLSCYSPWFMGGGTKSVFNLEDKANPDGPEGNRVRTYTGPDDYSREFGGKKAPIAVMGPDIAKNIALFDYKRDDGAGAMAQAGLKREAQNGGFKLLGTLWSPEPWVKVTYGYKLDDSKWPKPAKDTQTPFIWGGNYSGGKLDTSGTPLDVFNDGSGPTSSLTQFARSTAAWVKGFQDRYQVKFYAISLQNELTFPVFYNCCIYNKAADYAIAVKTVRAEFDKYPDLKPIRLIGPEDLLGGDCWGMWQLGSGVRQAQKNLQILKVLGDDPEAEKAMDLFCIHGYAGDGGTAAGDPQQWSWWVDGWTTPPNPVLPKNIGGFTSYHKKSWMTETSGEQNGWLTKPGEVGYGGFSIGLKMLKALTSGRESAFFYWQFAEKETTTTSCLTKKGGHPELEPKYVAAKHMYRYIRPGAVCLANTWDGPQQVASGVFWHAKDQTLTVVLVNAGKDPVDVEVKVPACAAALKSFASVTSSDGSYLVPGTAAVEAGVVKTSVPAFGMVTLQGGGGE